MIIKLWDSSGFWAPFRFHPESQKFLGCLKSVLLRHTGNHSTGRRKRKNESIRVFACLNPRGSGGLSA